MNIQQCTCGGSQMLQSIPCRCTLCSVTICWEDANLGYEDWRGVCRRQDMEHGWEAMQRVCRLPRFLLHVVAAAKLCNSGDEVRDLA